MADRFLVDTCVFVRWYIEQDGYQDALSLQSAYLAGGVELETVEEAADLAAHRMVSFFDALLLAWSLELGVPVLTTDKRLCSAAEGIAQTQLLSVSPS